MSGWTPQRDDARRLILDELADPEYAERQPNPLSEWLRTTWEGFLNWLTGLDGAGGGVPGWVILLAAAVVVTVLLIWLRPRFGARVKQEPAEQMLDVTLSAEQYRAAAAESARRGECNEALLGYFRAIVRHGQERVLLASRASLTATEASTSLTPVFPQHADQLARAARWFNDVAYGSRQARAEQVNSVAELDTQLTSAEVAR